MTFKRSSPIKFIHSEQSRIGRGLPFSIFLFFFGWWGIPLGIIHTIEALRINFQGGKDITAEITGAVGLHQFIPASGAK